MFHLTSIAWWEGFYECLVRMVKASLNKTLGQAFVTFEELQTILCEIEVAVCCEVLTHCPNHLRLCMQMVDYHTEF